MSDLEFKHGLPWNELVCISCGGGITNQPCDDHWFGDNPDSKHLATEVAKLKRLVTEQQVVIEELLKNKPPSYSEKNTKRVQQKKPVKFVGGYKWKNQK